MMRFSRSCLIAIFGLSILFGILGGVEKERALSYRAHSKVRTNHRMDLTVVGFVRIADGLGKQSVDLIESLRNSAKISFLSTCPIPETEIDLLPKFMQKILLDKTDKTSSARVLIYENSISSLSGRALSSKKFWKNLGLPERADAQIRFAYSMFESSLIPKEWVSIINESFDAVIVPDEFLVKVYKDSGVMKPVFVIPLGRDFSGFLQAPLKKERGDPMIFANYGTCFPRKNQLALVRAFGDAFGNNQDVQLHLRWREFDVDCRKKIFDEIHSRGLTNIKIEENAVKDALYLTEFLNVDCYVSISTGEGFSIQPREAMALGIPVIVSNNTGQKTICSSGLVRAVPSNIEIPAMYTFPGNFGLQYQCETGDVVAALRDVYENYDEYLQKGQKAREWAGLYQFQRMAPMYLSLIKPQKVILGNEDKILEGGIVTTSAKLVRKYNKIMKL